MLKFIDAIKWIVKLPVFWMPASWKKYRRIVVTGIIAFCTVAQGINWIDIADIICNVLGNAECNLKAIAVGIVTYVGLLYEALKSEAETSVFDVLKGGKAASLRHEELKKAA